jgi:hypothetical protein
MGFLAGTFPTDGHGFGRGKPSGFTPVAVSSADHGREYIEIGRAWALGLGMGHKKRRKPEEPTRKKTQKGKAMAMAIPRTHTHARTRTTTMSPPPAAGLRGFLDAHFASPDDLAAAPALAELLRRECDELRASLRRLEAQLAAAAASWLARSAGARSALRRVRCSTAGSPARLVSPHLPPSPRNTRPVPPPLSLIRRLGFPFFFRRSRRRGGRGGGDGAERRPARARAGDPTYRRHSALRGSASLPLSLSLSSLGYQLGNSTVSKSCTGMPAINHASCDIIACFNYCNTGIPYSWITHTVWLTYSWR